MDQRYRETIISILDALHFEAFLKKYSPKTSITCESFNKLSGLQFRLICYFLFYKYDREICVKRFRNVFPSRDHQQEAEFRKIFIEWLNRLGKIEPIAPIHYQRLCGAVFVRQMFSFANLILNHVVAKKRNQLINEIGHLNQDYLVRRQHEVGLYQKEIWEYQNKLDNQQGKFLEKMTHLERKEQHCSLSTIDSIEKVNLELKSQLASINKKIQSILPIGKEKNLIDLLQKDWDKVLVSLEYLLKNFQKFIEMIEVTPCQWISAFQNGKRKHELMRKLWEMNENAQSVIETSVKTKEELKQSLMSNGYVDRCRNQLVHYLQPFFRIDFSFE